MNAKETALNLAIDNLEKANETLTKAIELLQTEASYLLMPLPPQSQSSHPHLSKPARVFRK